MSEFFTSINSILEAMLFFDILFGLVEGTTIPFLVAWLIIGGVYLTFKMNFVGFKYFKHAYHIIIGRYKTKDDKGIIPPFGSLTTALSATVGLGNIAGVALAVSLGGPGATFWMIVAGFLGMSLKFTEVTLSLQHREFLKDGTVMGGAMEYLSKGLAQKGMPVFGKYLAILFAIFMIGGAIGGGNTFQVSQAVSAIGQEVSFFDENPIVFGFIIASFVGFVIIGGVSRIASITERLVPVMAIIYVGASLWILGFHYDKIAYAFGLIFTEAFTSNALYGGIIGSLVQGFQRAVFSSEAGIGSSPVAHAPAKTKYPVRQGMVALYEPFIDTIVICTMTALVIIITGVYDPNGAYAGLINSREGAALTAVAYGTVISWFPAILSVCIALFAFSTMISWAYYGERAWVYLFGSKYSIIYKLLFLSLTIIGSVVSTDILVNFSFMLLLAMALPNILGLFILSGDVKKDLVDYDKKLKSGELDKEAIRD
ncbi:MAG: alanine:cation symporter family protein [Campylobacteraceae bacterium]|jgi:AGCS family alanine or glycine:cation symporter|nr:alanine:cation symporter family protein [Campylobacteraceae bacterium]MBT3882224.1 alanine:cation symporter family protein [Campylobacteraceae bacterium]MBT4030622.1 alanine:cation symporter family protein [Campylobacteraceae bacterium]MBT4179728.1 alanine:cation symporter family protein [Campylobacteraceae bacterium]MBT4571937.1 alanine:cation symporter family protein [Campylobacteraceae bacterium]